MTKNKVDTTLLVKLHRHFRVIMRTNGKTWMEICEWSDPEYFDDVLSI